MAWSHQHRPGGRITAADPRVALKYIDPCFSGKETACAGASPVAYGRVAQQWPGGPQATPRATTATLPPYNFLYNYKNK